MKLTLPMPIFRRCGDVAAFVVMALFGIGARAAAVSVDAIPMSEEYFLRAWEADDGLSNNRVVGIAQTPDGYLWIATGDGLARFDGVRFVRFLQDSTPGLPSNRPTTLFVARDGALWIGFEPGGVARMKGRHFETIVPCPPATGRELISSIAQDADGTMWFGLYGEQKILRWRDGTLSTFWGKWMGPDLGTNCVVRTETSGKLWFATHLGCGFFDGKRFLPVDLPGGPIPSSLQHAMAECGR